MKKFTLSTILSLLIVLVAAAIAPVSVKAETAAITIHYHRDDGDYAKWNIWAWAQGADGTAYPFTDADAFGVVAEIEIDLKTQPKVGFIVRTDAWEKDVTDDRFIMLDEGNEIWVYTQTAEFFYDAPDGFTSGAREFEDMNIKINYFRYDGDYGDLTAVVSGGGNVWEIPINEATEFGMRGVLNVGAVSGISTAAFDIRRGGSVVDYADGSLKFSKADDDERLSVWARQGTGAVSYKPAEKPAVIEKAVILGANAIQVELGAPFNVSRLAFSIEGLGVLTPSDLVTNDKIFGELPDGYARAFTLMTDDKIDFSKEYTLAISGFDAKVIQLGDVFDSDDFASMFTYNDENGALGAAYTKEATTFTLWAPTASAAEVRFYDRGRPVPGVEDEYAAIAMTKGAFGSWTATAKGDMNGKFYMYAVTVGGEVREAVDPYARAVGVNGLRGQIIDLAATDPSDWAADKRVVTKNPTDAIVYELHVRDLSSQAESGIKNKGKFLGLTETGTTSPNGEKTGLDHIADLGVTHVHLLPSYDFKTVNELYPDDNEFNWGYDPQNYNTPEGSYSTNAQDGAVRVGEFKQMVKSLHDNGLGVVMDVVYNHMYDGETSNFQRLVPGYYFRFKPDGSYSNGSGCGNETASERAMTRKFIIDSVTYWAREYHVDGFRFDLMGLHDIETMNAVRAALDKIDPSILVYGEGWTGGGTTLPASKQSLKANAGKLDGHIAVFSDDIRDGIKGSVFDSLDPGYVNGRVQAVMEIKFGIVGSVRHPQVDMNRVSRSDDFWANDPTQTVTYASAHDNLTLWDKLTATAGGDSADPAVVERQNRLAAAIVLTSQGIPFFQAGEEMARTKGGDDNSYKSPDRVNKLDWTRKSEFIGLYNYYKGLIALRKATPTFRLATGDDVRKNLTFFDTGSETIIGYTIAANAGGGDTPVICVVFNGTDGDFEVSLPENGWNIMVDGESAGVSTLGGAGATLNAKAKSAYVLFRDENAATDGTAESAKTGGTSWPIVAGVAGVVIAAGAGAFVLAGRKGKKK